MNATDSPAEPARACHYCGRTGEPLAPCCDGHPDWMACLDVRDCRNALLAVLEAQRAAEGAQPTGPAEFLAARLDEDEAALNPRHLRLPGH